MIKACYNLVDCYELFSFSDDYKLCLSCGYSLGGPWTDWDFNQLAIISKNNNKCLFIIGAGLEYLKELNDPKSYVNSYLDSGNLNFCYNLVSFLIKEYNFDINEYINYQLIELIHKIVNNLIFI